MFNISNVNSFNNVVKFKGKNDPKNSNSKVDLSDKPDEFVKSDKKGDEKTGVTKKIAIAVVSIAAVAGTIIYAIRSKKNPATIVNDAGQAAQNLDGKVKDVKDSASEVLNAAEGASDKENILTDAQRAVSDLAEGAREFFVDITDKIIPGFKDRTIKKGVDLSMENLALVRMTDFVPENNIIQSSRDAMRDQNGVGSFRDSVHFALNHAVKDNNTGASWASQKYAIIAPIEDVIKENGKEVIAGGTPVDLWTAGSVKLPKGAIIVRHNPDIPKGKLRVVNSEAIDEFKSIHGVKVIETAESVHSSTNRIIEMMGFTNKSGNTAYGWGTLTETPTQNDVLDILGQVNMWKKFAASNGLKEGIHLYFPSSRAEHMIEGIELLGIDNKWSVENNGHEIINYKNEFLEVLKDVKKGLHKGYKASFDIEKFEKIIEESASPKDAMKRINDELKLRSLTSAEEMNAQTKAAYNRDISPLDIFAVIDMRVGLTPQSKKVHNVALDYFAKPQVNMDEFSSLDIAGSMYQASFPANPVVQSLKQVNVKA